ncbi:hypothetical protein [Paenibacillus sp. FSL H8-0034]|uniref:hypothetical protein n=1 Tax=Paenibacillus sp. FSL H8-0034 TaxID=2954671 RepID=UPI0030F70321
MKKVLVTVLIMFVLLSVNSIVISANSSSDVNIVVNSQRVQYTTKLDVDLSIHFSKIELYNDGVYLAYHLYDINDKEILWEGKRTPISVNDKGISNVKLYVDISTGIQPMELNYSKVKFDLVDEKNVMWFSTNPEIGFSSDQIVYQNDFLKRSIGMLILSIIHSPIIFSVNAVCFVLFIILFFKIRRSQIFSE